MIMKERILKVLGERDKLQDEILELIGYGSGDSSRLSWNEDEEWCIVGDTIHFLTDDYEGSPMNALEDGECYQYTIASYSAKGEKLYMKELEDITIVMAYPEDSSYEDTTIYILDNNKKFDYDEGYYD